MAMVERPQRTHRADEYLEAIYSLGAHGRVTVTGLARSVHVRPASASEMLVRLRGAGLVARRDDGRILLTAKGQIEAAHMVRRHRLSERFLADDLGLSWDKVHEEARKLEHALSDETEARLAEELGNPTTCPHGHPIPDERGRVRRTPTARLSDLRAGESGTVARILDESPGILRHLAQCGLLPGTRVTVEDVDPDAGLFFVLAGETRCALGSEVAEKVLIDA